MDFFSFILTQCAFYIVLKYPLITIFGVYTCSKCIVKIRIIIGDSCLTYKNNLSIYNWSDEFVRLKCMI